MSASFMPKGERGRWYYEIYNPAAMPSYEVGMEEWRTSQTPLATFAVATCIVVAATNTEWRTALLGHFSAPGMSSPDSDPDLFEHAVAELPNLGPPEHTRIRLAGGADAGTGIQERTRAYSETRVRETAEALGVAEDAVKVEWLDTHQLLAARVNPYLGRITTKLF